jgi:hypothetical protein
MARTFVHQRAAFGVVMTEREGRGFVEDQHQRALPGTGAQEVDHGVEQTKPRTLVGDVERRGLGQQWP